MIFERDTRGIITIEYLAHDAMFDVGALSMIIVWATLKRWALFDGLFLFFEGRILYVLIMATRAKVKQ